MRAQRQSVQPSPAGRSVLDRVSRQDIVDDTSRNQADLGERFWRLGHALILSIDEHYDGVVIEARVYGDRRQPFAQSIAITVIGNGVPLIEGKCSCHARLNCKHVAAAVFAAIADRPGAPRAAALKVVAGANRSGHAAPSRPFTPSLHTPSLRPAPAPPPTSLGSPLAGWIDMLAQLQGTAADHYPADMHQRLAYVLTVAPQPAQPAGALEIAVAPMSTRLLKSGRFSDHATFYDPENVLQPTVARHLQPSDRDILRRLHDLRREARAPGIALDGEQATGVVEAMIATGRARFGALDGPLVTRGPQRRGELVWRLADDGTQSADFEVEGAAGVRLLRLPPPWYVDPATAVMGPVKTAFAPRVAAAILAAPAVPVREAALLRKTIARRLPALAGVEPPKRQPPLQVGGPPLRRLQLLALRRRAPGRGVWLPGEAGADLAVARLSYRYGGIAIAVDEPRDRPTFARDGRIVEVSRSRSAESTAVAQLLALGFEPLGEHGVVGWDDARSTDFELADDAATDWLRVLYRDVPKLRDAGWEVEIAADFPVRLVVADGDIAADFHEGSGIDWFELDLGVMVGGERVDLVPAILAALAAPDFSVAADDAVPVYLPLGDGRTLALPAARIRPIIAILHDLFASGSLDAQAPRLGFSLREAAAIAELESTGVVWRGAERLRELGRLLRETGSIPRAKVPKGFTATLRPYQSRGVDWLQFLRAAGLGGVLADDMGLGKTVQTLAHLAIEKAAGRMDCPALVVAPTSVLPNWRREAGRLTPRLKVLVLHGLDRKSRFGDIADHDVVLTTYPLLARDHAVLKAQHWHFIVLDEAQVIKNPDTATTRLVFELQARHRLCLSGTPLENHLGEVWSLFAFLSPGFLGDRDSFKRQWRIPIEKRGDTERRRLLARRVRPFLLRRTKAEVATDLPPKTEIVEAVEMDGPQRDVYESIRLSMHAKVRGAIAAKGLARSRIEVLDALLKLRQACCDPRLLKLRRSGARAGSAKLERLMDMLPELIEGGRRVLLFSQFTSMLALIQAELQSAGIDYALLTGATRDRETPIRRFQNGKVPLFLISLKAGGLGLNLTTADTVIHYDPWWNPAVEDQATDRAHRIGQDKPVFVHKLVMMASIEEKIEVLKTRKRELAAGLFNPDAGSALDLTEADIQDLFAAA